MVYVIIVWIFPREFTHNGIVKIRLIGRQYCAIAINDRSGPFELPKKVIEEAMIRKMYEVIAI